MEEREEGKMSGRKRRGKWKLRNKGIEKKVRKQIKK